MPASEPLKRTSEAGFFICGLFICGLCLLLGKFCKAILAFARLNPLLTGVVIEAALITVCLSKRAQVNITGTSWALARENNLDQELVISAPNAPDTVPFCGEARASWLEFLLCSY